MGVWNAVEGNFNNKKITFIVLVLLYTWVTANWACVEV
jgi:hypothetical protein